MTVSYYQCIKEEYKSKVFLYKIVNCEKIKIFVYLINLQPVKRGHTRHLLDFLGLRDHDGGLLGRKKRNKRDSLVLMKRGKTGKKGCLVAGTIIFISDDSRSSVTLVLCLILVMYFNDTSETQKTTLSVESTSVVYLKYFNQRFGTGFSSYNNKEKGRLRSRRETKREKGAESFGRTQRQTNRHRENPIH